METVYVAMSGGVDSSVAAALLSAEGGSASGGKKYNVVGVFMRPWDPRVTSNLKIVNSNKKKPITNYQLPITCCLWQQDREDALRAAAVLGIPLLTWDFSKEYKKEVGDYMIHEYKAGRTPNPDVMCNKEIKFGLFLKKALKEGADFIATGHYVQIRRVNSNSKLVIKEKNKLSITNYQLLIAKDKNKDQSYFLWTLKQEQLKYCLFPIGNHTKPEVRKMAKKFSLPNHNKKDSQGVCFIGPLDMKEFLKRYIRSKPGKIIDQSGNIVGHHDGIYYYTIGQRHGLDIKNGQGPYYVIGKNLKKNIIYVGAEKDLVSQEAKVVNANWINKPKYSDKIQAKIRYRSMSTPVIISRSLQCGIRNRKYKIRFLNPARAITPGQSAVFYKGQEMLGGGIIES